MHLRFLYAALLTTVSLGIIYVWSLFLLPLEAVLSVSRLDLSVVSSVSLVALTIGLYYHDTLMRRLTVARLGPIVLAVGGIGHLAFAWSPGYWSLFFGYGVCFGLAVGVGFGFALALARVVLIPTQAWVVGVIAAVFALSGMLLSTAIAMMGGISSVVSLFALLGFALLAGAVLMAALLYRQDYPYVQQVVKVDVSRQVRSRAFWGLLLGNFSICYVGLMFVSHGAAILVYDSGDVAAGAQAPMALNGGYLLGALTGGVVAAKFPRRATPMLCCILCLASVCMYQLPVSMSIRLAATFCIGMTFGSTVSVFMMLLTAWFGRDKGGELFGRLGIGYGAAGLLAPTLSGWLYARQNHYDSALIVCTAVLLTGLAGLAVARKPVYTDVDL